MRVFRDFFWGVALNTTQVEKVVMAMLSIRGIDEQTSSLLKQEAKRRGISMNALILELLRRGIGLSPEKLIYHDLDHLAGTWTAEEAAAFLETQQDFERIEEDLWW